MKTVIKNEKKAPFRKKRVRGAPKLYEALFLIDSAEAAADWEGINSVIKGILEKDGAEIVSMRKWDERKLAYAISGKGKGTYILCYFKAEGGKLQNIERDIQLSERIMRALILCAEERSAEYIDMAPVSLSSVAAEPQTQTGELPATEVDRQEPAEEIGPGDLGQAD